MNYLIDINCDLGEGVGNDALLMPYLSSCNIACGGHAGSEETIRDTIQLALDNKTKIGAHPSFPDRENFGRIEMNLPSEELVKIIVEQISIVRRFSEEAGAQLNHVKPHGALYNMASVSGETANAIINAISTFGNEFILYVPFGSVMAEVALRKTMPIKYEVFADRNYNDDLTLVSRRQSNAVLHDPNQIFDHVVRMIKEQKVKTINGAVIDIKADTLCVHGDNPNAVAIVSSLSKKLKDANITIE